MAITTVNGIIQIATDSKTEWVSKNPILLKGELANSTYTISRTYNNVPYTYNTNDIKIGDNSAHYNDLKILNPIKTATGNCSIVSIASDNNQISDDIQNIANGENSIALGRKLTVLGNNSASIGNANFVGRDSSIAIGDNINIPAGGKRVIVVGRFNNSTDMADAVFVVGAGEASNSTKNGLIVKSTGEVKVETLNASSITATNVTTTNISIKGYPNTDNSIKLLGGYKSANDDTPKLAIQSTAAKGTKKYVVTSNDENSDINSIVSVAVNNWAHSAGQMTNPMTEDLDMDGNGINKLSSITGYNRNLTIDGSVTINNDIRFIKSQWRQSSKCIIGMYNDNNNTIGLLFNGYNNNHDIEVYADDWRPTSEKVLKYPILRNSRMSFAFGAQGGITLDDVPQDAYTPRSITEAMIDEKTKYYNVVSSDTPILNIDNLGNNLTDLGKYAESDPTSQSFWNSDNHTLAAANRKVKIPGNNSYVSIELAIETSSQQRTYQNEYIIINGVTTNITNTSDVSPYRFNGILNSDIEIIFENITPNIATVEYIKFIEFTESVVDSITIGKDLNSSPGQFIIGNYNKNNSKNAFELGNGTSNDNRHNAIEIERDGSVNSNTNITVDASELYITKENNTPIIADKFGKSSDITKNPKLPVISENTSQYGDYLTGSITPNANKTYLVVAKLKFKTFRPGTCQIAGLVRFNDGRNNPDMYYNLNGQKYIEDYLGGSDKVNTETIYTFCYVFKTDDNNSYRYYNVDSIGIGFKYIILSEKPTMKLSIDDFAIYPMTEIENNISYTAHKIYDDTNFTKTSSSNPYKYDNEIEYFADDDLFVNNKTNYTITIYPNEPSNPVSYIYGIPGKGATFSAIRENTVSIKDGRIRGLKYNPVFDDEPVSKKYINNVKELIDEKTKYYNVVSSDTPILTIDNLMENIDDLGEYESGSSIEPYWKPSEKYTLSAANRKVRIPGNKSYVSMELARSVIFQEPEQNLYIIINGVETDITNNISGVNPYRFNGILNSDIEIIFKNVNSDPDYATTEDIKFIEFSEMPLDSITIGEKLNASNGQFAIGRYNKNNPNNVFEIGNGTDDKHRSNVFYIDKDGNTSIDVPAALEHKGIIDLAVSNLYFGAIDPSTHDYTLPAPKLYESISSQNEYDAFISEYYGKPLDSTTPPLFVLSTYSAHAGFFILYTDSNQKCHWKDMNGNEFLTSN